MHFFHNYVALKTTPPSTIEIKFIFRKIKFSYEFIDIHVCGVEMSIFHQKPSEKNQIWIFRYFRAPKPPQANPKIPIPY